jgi:tetratricopeptide (TPR) repeat protein
MKRIPFLIPVLFLAACTQNSSPNSSEPPSTPPEALQQPATSAPAMQPPQLSLYMVPLDQSGFSMEKIQADKKKIEQDPNNVPALVSLGDANFMIQRFEKAQEYYERALKTDAKNLNVRLSLSNCYIFMQKPDESIRELDQILATQKDQPEALYNKGLILLQSKGDRAAAKEAWTRLVAAHPDNPLAQDVKDEMGRL